MPQSQFDSSLSAQTLLNPITGETIFELRNQSAISVFLVGNFGRIHPAILPLLCQDDSWVVRLFLLPGCYEFGFEVDGVFRLAGVAEVKLDYRSLPIEVLEELALTHTCFCHAHKWN